MTRKRNIFLCVFSMGGANKDNGTTFFFQKRPFPLHFVYRQLRALRCTHVKNLRGKI